jgi:hypothetical protein
MAEPRPILKPESIGRECEASLRRLGVERIDEAFSEKHLACTVHKLGSFGSLKFPCGFAHAHEAQESYGEERRSAVSTDWGLVACDFQYCTGVKTAAQLIFEQLLPY